MSKYNSQGEGRDPNDNTYLVTSAAKIALWRCMSYVAQYSTIGAFGFGIVQIHFFIITDRWICRKKGEFKILV